jgi:hypothetical protein
MADITQSLVKRIKAHALPGLVLGPGTIHPMYEGLSLLNLPASLCKWFDSRPLPHPPLAIPELDDLAENAEQVIVVLTDAVALHRFQRWMDGRAGHLQDLARSGILGALTSIVPSTTSAALTTLWTGRSPAEHGVLGYEIFLREFSLVANMITHAPAVFEGNAGLLYRAGFDPESFLPVPTLGPSLREAGVNAHAFLHYSISRSGLSRMHYPAVEVHPYGGVPDLWVSVRQLVEKNLSGKRLVWVYFGGVDGTSHRYGPDAPQPEAEYVNFTRSMMEDFLLPLEPASRDSTLLIMLADHGQLGTRNDPRYELRNHPGLIDRLHILPTGENRLAYLHAKPGQVDAATEYIDRSWPGEFTILPSSYALENGLFGPGEHARSSADRIGDRVVIGQDAAYLWWAEKENPLIGRHGGLSEDEMLVPLLAARLD